MRHDPPDAADHHRADLEQFHPDCRRLCPRKFRPRQSRATQRLDRRVCKTTQQQPELVGGELVATVTPGEQPQLLLLDPVLLLPPGALQLVIDLLCPPRHAVVRQTGDDQAWIGSLAVVPGFMDDPTLAVLRAGGVVEAGEEPLLLPGLFALRLNLEH